MADKKKSSPKVEPAAPVAQEPEPAPALPPPPVAPAPAALPPARTSGVDAQSPQTVVAPQQQLPFLVRAIWFILVGWWLTAIVIVLAYALAITVLGLPFAFALFNRIPAFLTLRRRTKTYQVETNAEGTRYLTSKNVAQRPLLLRAIWFILVGWWFGLIWMVLAYALCILIVTMPFGLAMFNRVGAVMTLMRY
jgi:uncharacterized membrane protein YccF (DUF307 family)